MSFCGWCPMRSEKAPTQFQVQRVMSTHVTNRTGLGKGCPRGPKMILLTQTLTA